MKKFISGVIVGVGISACSVAFASDGLQAFLFPSKVTFHNNGMTNEVSFSKDDPVINFNNKAYIPLRLFSETLHAQVNYSTPSDSSDGTNLIDIYLNDDNFVIPDNEKIISIRNIESNPTGGHTFSLSGLITTNKSLEGKIIELHALDANKKIIGSNAEINIDGAAALNVGETRKFSTSIYSKETPIAYEVVLKDSWGLTQLDYFMDGMLQNVAGISFGPPAIDLNKHALISHLQFKNQSDKDIFIEPLSIEYQINKVIGDKKELIKSYKLASLQNKIPSMSWYQASIPAWNLRDQNGSPVAAGSYEVSIIVPNSLTFTSEGTSEKQTLTNFSNYTKWDVEITQDQINKITNTN
ncbi:hypothetical protein GQF01_00585 [Paenibacillus sp. 5J-6]|uniref:Copper amine oxidase-like N-terminal domain-containing protein n=1 Tax=Paenibacillus silvestris TaxID=2606219 RepID=A0A6L8UT63_9BACL|nr:hypothetical protein [Paenibacillus silvestris]MZQ80651.1 hypothetical protein [Paenibacillus silvestris]